jgi:phosphoglycolate phosphatase-like HAD superfamily hydrolase
MAHNHTRVSSMSEVADVLDSVGAILLDFDGPICSVFAAYPAPQVADELRKHLATRGIAAVAALTEIADPLEILRWVAATHPGMASEVDDVMRAAESKAVQGALPTAYAHDAIRAAKLSAHVVAIVSNNAEGAISDYLAVHHLSDHVAFIAGRAYGAPELMKPHPDSVERAIRHLGIEASLCAFVGDSATDMEVSHLAGVRPIGYATTPAHHTDLTNAGAEVVIDTMRDLVTALATV